MPVTAIQAFFHPKVDRAGERVQNCVHSRIGNEEKPLEFKGLGNRLRFFPVLDCTRQVLILDI